MSHFSRDELDARLERARSLLKARGFAGLLLFAQESHFYLTGYDTSGYVFFQCAVLPADGRPMVLLTRRPDVQQAKETSTIEDIRVWHDTEDANPALDLRAILDELGFEGARLGVELATHGLTGANWERVRRALDGWCTLEDASDLVRSLRVVKSEQELVYVRKAAQLADDALLAMIAAIEPGRLDTAVTAAGMKAILEGGGDMPPAGPLLNSGRRALYGRGVCGEHMIEAQDQISIEFAATYHRYNCCIQRTAVVGEPSARHRTLFATVREAIGAMVEAAVPGRPLGEIDDAHRRVFDAAGHQVNRFAACGYSLGATYRPLWMDVPPMLFSGNRTEARPGMVIFLNAMLPDPGSGLAMSLGHTIVVTERGCEVLSRLPLELPVVA
ncbi:MAG: Xaa-Pro peptidase family protein [Alphaproteobacteria bacterium]